MLILSIALVSFGLRVKWLGGCCWLFEKRSFISKSRCLPGFCSPPHRLSIFHSLLWNFIFFFLMLYSSSWRSGALYSVHKENRFLLGTNLIRTKIRGLCPCCKQWKFLKMVQEDTFMNTRHIVGFKCHMQLWTLNKKARRSHTISMISARETRIKTWGWPEKHWYQNRTAWPWPPLETVGECWDESNRIGICQRSDEKSDQVKESILFVFSVSRVSISLATL